MKEPIIDRRGLIKNIISFFGLSFVGIPFSEKKESGVYYYAIAHSTDDMPTYSKELNSWLDLKKFKSLNQDFLNQKKLLKYKASKDFKSCLYEWWFIDKKSYLQFENEVVIRKIISHEKFLQMNIASQKKHVA